MNPFIPILCWFSGVFVGLALLANERRSFGQASIACLVFLIVAILLTGFAAILYLEGASNA